MADNTAATLSALFKEIYNSQEENLIPDGVKFLKKVGFASADKELGDKFILPVQLTHEHGFTYLGTNAGVSTLNASEAAVYQEAQIDAYGIILRSAISYSAAAKLSNNKKAFAKWSELIVSNMVNSMSKRLEIQCLYGQTGLGAISVDGNPDFTISDATWAAGIWAGMENVKVDVYNSDLTTKVNTNADLVVSAVDLDNKQVTLTGNATDLTNIVVGDVFFFKGANGSEMAGLDKIITNTGSLFNISAATYALWKGNSFSAGSAALTFAKVLNGLSGAVQRGLDEDICLMISPRTFANLNNDLAALRQYDNSYKGGMLEQGTEAIKYHYQAGTVEVVPSIYVKEGEGFAFPVKRVKRVGTVDTTFKMPGKSDTEIFLNLPDQSGYELRLFTEQAVYAETPARLVKFTNIVNS